MLITIIVFLVILSLLVLVHEAGHFFTAKKFGIKVEEFGFGFPPRLFAKKIGETLYSINWLPIGGFVKLYGEDEAGGGKIRISKSEIRNNKEDIKRAFFARPVWQRALVIVAGVAMNFLLSVVIISYMFGVSGVKMPADKVIVTDLVKGAPAEVAGIKKGDTIEAINGTKITNTDQLISITKKHLGEEIVLRINPSTKFRVKDQPFDKVQGKKSNIKDIKLIPRKTYPKNEGPMGIAISQDIITKKYPLYLAPLVGTKEALHTSWLIVSGLGKMVFDLISQGQAPEGVAGPVGIARLTGQFVEIGPLAVMSFLAILSLNLAILNILPIPALDGGRLFFILIELILGKRVSQKFEAKAHAVGMAILLTLVAVITLNDIIKVFSGQPIIPKP